MSEKLDGSNFSVTSQGVIASRRKVVLVRPDADTLSSFNFIGASLAKLDGVVEKVEALKEKFEILSGGNGAVEECLVYGELVTKTGGERVGNEERYSYKQRGITVGDYAIFGVGLKLAEGVDQKAVTAVLKGHNMQVFANSFQTRMMHISMNNHLKELLHSCGLEQVVEVEAVAFRDLVARYKERLVRGEVEGVVISTEDKVMKWKSSTEEVKKYEAEVLSLKNKIDSELFEALQEIGEESLKRQAGKGLTQNMLQVAYESALTKMRTLEEHMDDGGTLEEYKVEVEKEMAHDSGPDTFNIELIHQFVSSVLDKRGVL